MEGKKRQQCRKRARKMSTIRASAISTFSTMRKHPRSLVTTDLPVSMMAAAVAASAVASGAATATPSNSSSSSSAASPPDAGAAAPSAISGVPELRMLKLFERQSSCCVFTEQWKWHPHAYAEGVDALVQSFTQFAREIDGGGALKKDIFATGAARVLE